MVYQYVETQVQQWPSVLVNTPVPVCQYQKVERQSVGIWVCKKCDHTFAGGAWEPFTRASEANNRILRRSVDGATTADMAFIAQEAAMNYERELAEGMHASEEEE